MVRGLNQTILYFRNILYFAKQENVSEVKDGQVWILEPASTTAGAIRVVRGLNQTYRSEDPNDENLYIDVLVANMDTKVNCKKNALISTAFVCDYKRLIQDKHLSYYKGCDAVDLHMEPQAKPNISSIKSYKEYYDSKRW